MHGAKFTEYCKKLCFDFLTSCKKVKERQQKDDIHVLRVSIKKLRVVWSVTELASNGAWVQKGFRKHTKKLFKLAGKVRDDQLNQELTKELISDKSNPYCKALSISEYYHTEHLKMFLTKYDLKVVENLNKKMVDTIDSIPTTNIGRAIEELFVAEKQSVLIYIKMIPEKARLHKIRIHLKNIQYLMALGAKDKLFTVKESFVKRVRKKTDALGKWHDYESLLNSMDAYEINNPEHSKDLFFRKNIEKKLEERNKAIISQLSSCEEFFEDALV